MEPEDDTSFNILAFAEGPLFTLLSTTGSYNDLFHSYINVN